MGLSGNVPNFVIVTNEAIDYGVLYSNCSTRTGFNYHGAMYCTDTADHGCMSSSSSIYSSLRSLAIHCYPQLVFPSRIQAMNPAWSSCNKASGLPQNGVFDPPRALRPGAASETTAINNPNHPPTAVPASQISNPEAPMTTSPSRLLPTSSTENPSTGGSVDPGDSKHPATGNSQMDLPLDNHGSDPASNAGVVLPQANQNAPKNEPGIDDAPSNIDSQPEPPAGDKPSDPDLNAVDPAPVPPATPTFALTLSDGQTLPATIIDPTAIAVRGSTVRGGESAVQVSGHQISIDPATSKIVVDGHELPLPRQSPASPLPAEAVAAGLSYALASTPVSSLVVGSVTVIPNGPPATLSGTQVSLGSDAFIVGSLTVALAGHPASAPGSATTLDGHLIQAVPSSPGVALVDGQSLTMGDNPSPVMGPSAVLQTNGNLVLGSSTIYKFLPPSPSVSYFTVGSETLTLLQGQLLASGTILAPGDPGVNIDGTLVSFGSSVLQIGAATIPVFAPTPVPQDPKITAPGHLATLLPNGVDIAGTIITLNAPAVTLSGTRISLGPSGLAVGTSTIAVSLPSTPILSPIVTGAGQMVTLLPTGVVVDGTTISANGSALTISGTRMSLGNGGLVVGSSTIALALPSLRDSSFIITTLGQTMTIMPGGLVDAGTTIRLGDARITLSGTRIALESDGIVIGSSTIPYPKLKSASTKGLGESILGGLNGGFPTPITDSLSAGSNETAQNYTGSASEPESFRGLADRLSCWYNGLIVVIALFWLSAI